ncbi:hypothetical protein GF357_03220 [Candidatus Dojkabacteria bacterium]|nr:hypothetical protein [Candidatus Dojkabacteria bacterium]
MSDHESFRQLVEKSVNILITTHKSPDPDALTSSLLTLHFLKKLYPAKYYEIVVKGPKSDKEVLTELPGFDKIRWIPRREPFDFSTYDLVIILDAGNLHMVSKKIDMHDDTTIVAIDHHDVKPNSEISLVINEGDSAASETVFTLFKKLSGKDFTIDKITAELTQIGIISDTNRFMWEKVSTQTYQIMADCTKVYKINMEKLFKKLIINTRDSIYVFGHILKNAVFNDDLVYSHISPTFVARKGLTEDDVSSGTSHFLNFYIRTLEDINWGFIVKKTSHTSGLWTVSLRSIAGSLDVMEIAQKLGGGGHTHAASTRIRADSYKDAVSQVLDFVPLSYR